MKVLFLRKMGMDDVKLYDVRNHRVRVLERIHTTLRNEPMFFEFTQCDMHKMRYTHKITGRELKHPIYESVNPIGLHLDTEFTNEFGSYRDLAVEKAVWDMYLDFTRESILKVVNMYSVDKFAKVVFVDEAATDIIKEMGGYREREILGNDCVFSPTETWNESHKVVRVTERINHNLGDSCEVDLITRKIVG